MTTTNRISILDLSIKDIASIERATGARMTEWPDGVASVADLYARIYAAGTGTDMETVEAMTLKELSDMVVLATGDEEETADPT